MIEYTEKVHSAVRALPHLLQMARVLKRPALKEMVRQDASSVLNDIKKARSALELELVQLGHAEYRVQRVLQELIKI